MPQNSYFRQIRTNSMVMLLRFLTSRHGENQGETQAERYESTQNRIRLSPTAREARVRVWREKQYNAAAYECIHGSVNKRGLHVLPVQVAGMLAEHARLLPIPYSTK